MGFQVQTYSAPGMVKPLARSAGVPYQWTNPPWRVLSAWWGAPHPEAMQVLEAEELLTLAWSTGRGWAVVPFESLEPRWKVLEVDGQSPIRKEFDPAVYALALPLSLSGPPELLGAYGSALAPGSNRDPGKMTVVAMTGVTALVRATAYAMERRGLLYPAEDIGAILAEADITHISNEVPFADGLPLP